MEINASIHKMARGLGAETEVTFRPKVTSFVKGRYYHEKIDGVEAAHVKAKDRLAFGEWCAELDPDWVIQAMDITRIKGAGIEYARGILTRWEKEGGPPTTSQRNGAAPTSLPVRRSVSFDDPDYVGNMKHKWPTEEEMRAKEARQ